MYTLVMRTLFNALQAGNRSGTGVYAYELARVLPIIEQGPDVSVLWPEGLPTPNPAHAALWEEHAIRMPVEPLRRRLVTEHWGMTRLAAEAKADLVHYPANFGAALARVPTVVTVHDLSFFRNPEWFRPMHAHYYRLAARRTIPRAMRVIADSEATAADLESYLRIPRKRIDVIPLGVDPHFTRAPAEEQERVRVRHGLPQDFVLYYGTLEPRKNLPRLIRAWDRHADEHRQALVLAGRRGWKTEAIDEAIAQAQHKDWIYRPGFVEYEELPALISASHCFVWPSLWEGFGLPPLEAMACRTPVLTSNCSSLPEVVGDAALLVDPESEDEIAAGIWRIIEDDSLREILLDAGKARKNQFVWRQTAEATLVSYRKAMAG